MKSKEIVCAALAQALMDYLDLMNNHREEPAPGPRLYAYSDLAELLGKSKDTIRQWVCAGEFGEPVKVGNSTRVTQAGLDKFICDHSDPTEKMPSRARKRATKATKPLECPLGI